MQSKVTTPLCFTPQGTPQLLEITTYFTSFRRTCFKRGETPWAWGAGSRVRILTREASLPALACCLPVWVAEALSHTLVALQFSSVAQSCPTLCNLMNRSTPGLPVHHQLPGSTQTHCDSRTLQNTASLLVFNGPFKRKC